jgi:MerR family transcriptional regulator, light-induced transcriptional regulator
MSSLDEVPTYNLKAVVQETGLKPDTLRAWERRYGLPQPARTSGGHRLYSQRDIQMLNWLAERQEEGLSISRAVGLWKQLVAEGREPMLEMGDQPDAGGPMPLEIGSTLSDLRDSWVEACLAFDEQQANHVLAQVFALYPPEVGCIEVLQKGLAQIGERWYEGEITVQQEHFASEIAMRRLETLLAANPAPMQTSRVVIACPPGEEHTFSPLLLTLLLRRRGWSAIYLGADVPLQGLESMVRQTRPALVILSAQMLPAAAAVLPLAHFLHDEGITLAFGGRIFNQAPSVRAHIPGHFLGEQLDQAVHVVEQLLRQPVRSPVASPVDPKHDVALRHFRVRQALIEAAIWENASRANIRQDELAQANRRLANGIWAALILGDIHLVDHELAWVEGLIANTGAFGGEDGPLGQYLRAYHAAAKANLDERGALIVAWLADAARRHDAQHN